MYGRCVERANPGYGAIQRGPLRHWSAPLQSGLIFLETRRALGGVTSRQVCIKASSCLCRSWLWRRSTSGRSYPPVDSHTAMVTSSALRCFSSLVRPAAVLLNRTTGSATETSRLTLPTCKRQVTAPDSPFVVLLSQHRIHQPARCRPVREDTHHIRSPAPADLLV